MSGAPIIIPTRKERIAALDEAVKRGGGIVAFARRMGVSHQAVYHWKKMGWTPLLRALAIEAMFGIDRNLLMEPGIVHALATPSASIVGGTEHDL